MYELKLLRITVQHGGLHYEPQFTLSKLYLVKCLLNHQSSSVPNREFGLGGVLSSYYLRYDVSTPFTVLSPTNNGSVEVPHRQTGHVYFAPSLPFVSCILDYYWG